MVSGPFSLSIGQSVQAKVIATNVKGDSLESQPGSGAIIITRPDSPINLLEDTSQRTKSALAITWEAAAYDGLSPVIDYSINMAE